MSASVTFIDNGLSKLQQNFDELRRLKARVGYQSPEGKQRYSSGITVAKLAAVHEFGASSPEDGLPARSFIRSTLHEKRGAIAAELERQMVDMVEGRISPVEAMSAVGKFAVGLIRDKLDSAASWAEPLDAATVERKGGAVPLEETELLKRSLSWSVSRGREQLARGAAE